MVHKISNVSPRIDVYFVWGTYEEMAEDCDNILGQFDGHVIEKKRAQFRKEAFRPRRGEFNGVPREKRGETFAIVRVFSEWFQKTYRGQKQLRDAEITGTLCHEISHLRDFILQSVLRLKEFPADTELSARIMQDFLVEAILHGVGQMPSRCRKTTKTD